jgi:CheY-like chemotaxis protein
MELLRDQMARCLERNGFMTDRAANGLEAFRLLERLLDEAKRPDVLVVDGHMPIANGWQLIRTLRSTPAFLLLPVLFVSGSAEDTGGVEEFSPPVRFLPKPFDCTALIDAVEGLLAAS